MITKEEIDIIRNWANSIFLIKKIYLFGSRSRDDYRFDSDLDLAVVLDYTASHHPDESKGHFATWAFEKAHWTQELENILPYKIHLSRYEGIDTEVIHKAIEHSSNLIYEKI